MTSIRHWTTDLLRSGRLPALFIALACAVTIYGFLETGDYRVDTVLVHGASIGDPREVAGASGAVDRSIFRVDPDAAAEKIVKLPWVSRTSVHLEFPDRLVVDLVERTPAAVWQDGSSSVLVDASGQVLLAADADGLPHVLDAGQHLAPGDAVAALDVAAVQAIHDALGQSLASLEWTESDGFRASLDDGRTVVFGDSSQMPLKISGMSAFFSQTSSDWTLLDVSEPERPYFR